jgi:hypothetical protein
LNLHFKLFIFYFFKLFLKIKKKDLYFEGVQIKLVKNFSAEKEKELIWNCSPILIKKNQKTINIETFEEIEAGSYKITNLILRIGNFKINNEIHSSTHFNSIFPKLPFYIFISNPIPESTISLSTKECFFVEQINNLGFIIKSTELISEINIKLSSIEDGFQIIKNIEENEKENYLITINNKISKNYYNLNENNEISIKGVLFKPGDTIELFVPIKVKKNSRGGNVIT